MSSEEDHRGETGKNQRHQLKRQENAVDEEAAQSRQELLLLWLCGQLQLLQQLQQLQHLQEHLQRQ